MRGRALGRGRLVRETNKLGQAVYFADWRGADGTRHRQVMCSDRRVAERMLADLVRDRDLQLAGLKTEEAAPCALAELKDLYLKDLETRVSAKHCANARRRIARILNEVSISIAQDLTPARILEWRRARLGEGVANRTANMDVSTLTSMLIWAVRMEIIQFNPIASVKPLPQGKAHQRRNRRAMTEAEVARFLEAADEDDRRESARWAAATTIAHGTKGRAYANQERIQRIPQRPMWEAFLLTGARWSELTRTAWGDLDEERATLTLRAEHTKSGNLRVIPLQRDLASLLANVRTLQKDVLRSDISDAGRIFLTPEGMQWPRLTRNAMRIFERILTAAGIVKMNSQKETLDIHALRHTFASRLARAGVGLIQAQKLLGHSDPKLTAQIYTHLDAEDLRDAIERVPRSEPPKPRIDGAKLALVKGGYRVANPKSLSLLERARRFELPTFSLGKALLGTRGNHLSRYGG
ncbi:MAG: site-specific integrase [Planctomycetes bacterium]|nr:site-specific integrase [Planctomycetota bacterium]